MKAKINHRSDPFLPFGFPLYLRLMRIKWCGVVCVTFKFVCFDGIEGKNLADEVLRKKKRKRKRKKESFVEHSGAWRKWYGKREERRKTGKESGYVCGGEKKREKEKEKKRKCGK